MFFDSWMELGRTVAGGVVAYAALVALLRVSGNRSLSKLNAFDLVVTVALGSTLATILLSKDVALAEGVAALALLLLLQWLVSWSSVRSGLIRRAVTSRPVLLLHRGRLLEDAMRKERVADGELLAALRSQGVARIEDVRAVVLETDGTLSVVRGGEGQGATTLRDTPGAAEADA